MVEVITNPWKKKLLNLVSGSNKSIKITSPYIKEDVCNEVLLAKKSNTKFELITSFKLMNIYSGSIDISAVENIINHNGIVRNFSKLHSKIYLFDDKEVVITSGNLTNGGLLKNYECGIYTNDDRIVSKVVSDFLFLSQNQNTGTIKKTDIDMVRKILSKVPKTESIKLPKFEIEMPEEINDIIDIPQSSIIQSIKGWKLDVFNCLNNLTKQEFTLKDIYSFETALSILHPKNNNVKDKIRQQLQSLRDIGLIEFYGNGCYKKLWK
jgi:hypothetical protein